MNQYFLNSRLLNNLCILLFHSHLVFLTPSSFVRVFIHFFRKLRIHYYCHKLRTSWFFERVAIQRMRFAWFERSVKHGTNDFIILFIPFQRAQIKWNNISLRRAQIKMVCCCTSLHHAWPEKTKFESKLYLNRQI